MATLGTIRNSPNKSYQPGLDIKLQRGSSLYGIAFDMDIEALETHYGNSYNNAYGEIKKILVAHGFTRQQVSVYFGSESINAVACVLTAIDLAKSLPWFGLSVRDIRMLRIEELNDLMPAVQQGQLQL